MNRFAVILIVLGLVFFTFSWGKETPFNGEIYQIKKREQNLIEAHREGVPEMLDISFDDLHRPENKQAFLKLVNDTFQKKRGFVKVVFQENFLMKNPEPYSNRFPNGDKALINHLNKRHAKAIWFTENQIYFSDEQQKQLYHFISETLHTPNSKARIGPPEARESFFILCYLQHFPDKAGLILLNIKIAVKAIRIPYNTAYYSKGDLIFQIQDNQFSIYKKE